MVTGTRAGDLVKLCNEKFHPGLNAALAASGSPSLEGGGIASARAPAPARSPPPPPTRPPPHTLTLQLPSKKLSGQHGRRSHVRQRKP